MRLNQKNYCAIVVGLAVTMTAVYVVSLIFMLPDTFVEPFAVPTVVFKARVMAAFSAVGLMLPLLGLASLNASQKG